MFNILSNDNDLEERSALYVCIAATPPAEWY